MSLKGDPIANITSRDAKRYHVKHFRQFPNVHKRMPPAPREGQPARHRQTLNEARNLESRRQRGGISVLTIVNLQSSIRFGWERKVSAVMVGKPCGPVIQVCYNVCCFSGRQQLSRAFFTNFILIANHSVVGFPKCGSDYNIIFKTSRCFVSAFCLRHYQKATLFGFHLAIVKSLRLAPCNSADFKPNQVIGGGRGEMPV